MPLAVDQQIVLRSVHGPSIRQMEFPAAIAQCSNSLTVVTYEIAEQNEIRARAFNPVTGAVYHDSNLWTSPYASFTYARNFLVRSSDTKAFGIITSFDESWVYTVDSIGAHLGTHFTNNHVGGWPDTGGPPGKAYISDINFRISRTVDVETFAYTTESWTPLPANTANLSARGDLWRGGYAMIGYGASDMGDYGTLYWFHPVTGTWGWHTYAAGFPADHPDWYPSLVSAGSNFLITRRLGHHGGPNYGYFTTTYNPATDTFSTGELNEGFRIPARSGPSDPPLWAFDFRFEHGCDLLGGYVVPRDAAWVETGMADQYLFNIWISDKTGQSNDIDFAFEPAFAPDYIDFNSFTDFAFADTSVYGDRWATVMTATSGTWDPDTDIEQYEVLMVIATGRVFGSVAGAWHIGRIATGAW